MKRLALPFVLGFGVCLIVLASPARGQERVARTGNTEIVFAPADSTDIPIDDTRRSTSSPTIIRIL